MSAAAAGDSLPDLLARLRLTALRERLDGLLDEAARRDLSLRETLALLCEAEVAHREERRVQMGTSIAKFPHQRTLEGFDSAAQPSIDPKQVRELAKPKLLIIDEFGYLPFEPAAAHLLFQRVARRHERGSILVTSNRTVGDWGAVLNEPNTSICP